MEIQSSSPNEKEYNPLIIAHRGYSSLFPQNTLQSLQAGLHKADYVEFDILLTKDNQIVVFHDRYLSLMTDVEIYSQFASKKSEFVNNIMKGESTNDWWVRDFTVDELRKLRVKQKSSKRPQLRHQAFRISTLDELIEEILYVKQNHLKDNVSGFLIEIKGEQECNENAERDDIFVSKLVEYLERNDLTSKQKCEEKRLPIILQSFNQKIMKALAQQASLDLPLVHLYDKNIIISKEFLSAQISPKSLGIAISKDHANKQIKELCQSFGLKLFFWAFVDDETHLLPPSAPSYKEAYFYLFLLGLEGIITDFPENCAAYLSLFKALKK